ncbi:MAG: FtsQ-type POTRA domain-containing protein [Polyangia bacterium]
MLRPTSPPVADRNQRTPEPRKPRRSGLRLPFAGKGNRRVRLSSTELPTLALGAHLHAIGRVALCVLFAACIVGAGVGLRWFLVRGTRFSLVEVRFSGLHRLEAGKLIAASGLPMGQSLFSLDLSSVEKRLAKEPWVASVRVRRELPHTVAVDIVERDARVAVALGHLYLADERGELFKRATPEEQAGLPVVTGLSRDRWSAEPVAARGIVRRAIDLDRSWREHGARPPLGELHHDSGRDAAAMFTAYFEHAGKPVAVRLGSVDVTTPARLVRLDAVLAALDQDGARAQLIHLDQRGKLDRIAVRLWTQSAQDQATHDGADAPGTQQL